MLLRWRDEADLFFCPVGVALRHRPARWFRAQRSSYWPADTAGGGAGLLAALAAALDALPRRAALRVIVSNHFVRYTPSPFSDRLIGDSANEALATQVLRQIHGETAAAWRVRVARARPGQKRLASAVDGHIVDALKEAARARGLLVRRIEPALMTAFNAARRVLPLTAWFAVIEPGKLVLARLQAGEWQRIVTERTTGDTEAALGVRLKRERLLAGLPEHADDSCWLARFANPCQDAGRAAQPTIMRLDPPVPSEETTPTGGGA